MERQELKALIMAIQSPNGVGVNMNPSMMDHLDKNSDSILERCGIPKPEEKKEVTNG